MGGADAYNAQRGAERLVAFDTAGVENWYAGVLRADFKDPSRAAVGVEFVGGSVISFGSAEMTGHDLTEPGRRLVPHVNPHIAYLDLKHHVSTKVIVSPTHLDVRYFMVRMDTQPTPSAFLLQRFIVPSGGGSYPGC
jgi:hypothetical protein